MRTSVIVLIWPYMLLGRKCPHQTNDWRIKRSLFLINYYILLLSSNRIMIILVNDGPRKASDYRICFSRDLQMCIHVVVCHVGRHRKSPAYCSRLHWPLRQKATKAGRRGFSDDIREWLARDAGLIPTLGTIFHIFITPMTMVVMTITLCKLCIAWLLNLPCECEITACM